MRQGKPYIQPAKYLPAPPPPGETNIRVRLFKSRPRRRSLLRLSSPAVVTAPSPPRETNIRVGLFKPRPRRRNLLRLFPPAVVAAAANSDYIAEVLTDTPKAFWEAQDASGNPVDSSGNALNMTSVTGTPLYHAAGPMSDYGIEFDGGEYVSRALVSTVTNDFTIECWLMYRAGSSDRVIWNGSLGANGWALYLNNAQKIIGLAGGVAFLTAGTTALTADTWYHVALVRDSANSNKWTYYLNGAVDLANAGTTAPNAPSGGDTGFGSRDGAAQHRIAYAAIYETALSAARISAHYNASLP